MKRLFAIFVALCTVFVAVAQSEHSIIIDQNSFRLVQTDPLTKVNIDPIAIDSSRRPCARIKMKINRMSREEINGLEVKIHTNNELTKCKTAEYDNGLILELTAKSATRFYLYHPEFGYSNEVTLNLEPNKEYYIEASLNQTYSIIVDSNVTGADVYLDGFFKGRIGDNFRCTISDVMVGEHRLKVCYSNIDHEQKIVVNKNSISFRHNVDTAASEPQFVVFTVEPQSAVVIINNQHYTLTDGAMNVVLDRGTYNYTVTAAGYHPQSGTFSVAGSKVSKNITLTADSATITLTAPDNAEIWINGVKKGTSSWSGTLNSGTYIFEARKAGHKSATLSKHITSAELRQSYTLPAPTPIVGSIIISGTPINADVTLDGKAVGQLPLKLNDILVGEHTIVVSKSGYETYTQSITIAEGKTTTINATLTKQVAQVPNTPSSSSAKFGDIEMVYVKGGTFTMGAISEQGADAYDDEKPAHSVTLSDFYIGKYEVTQAQWRAVMGSNPSSFKGDNLPVENVSWNDIQKFIQKLNAQTGKEFRLPTEAEWEYAARGGSKSRGYKYSGSNNIGDVAWYSGNSGSKTHPVGQKQPNELGIYDMSGNVWEWCSDWYGSYSSSSQTNPKGPNSGDYRVLRGGDWGMIFWKNIYSRTYANPDRGRMYNGFRLACSSKSNTAKTYYKVGDYYNDGTKEGVVFEVSADGKHGKIVSMTQSSRTLQWSSDATEQKRLVGADSQTDGAVNMAIIKSISGWESKYPAFKWCADLGEGWYLPANEELLTIYSNKDVVNANLVYKLSSSYYWSSTEKYWQFYDEFCAWYVTMDYGFPGNDTKNYRNYVRAVSAF